MRKNTMFISAALTAFVLAMLAGVVSAYAGISGSLTQAQPASVAQPKALPVIATPSQPTVVTAQDAAAIASAYIKRADLYSVELADLNGQSTDAKNVQTYKVTFSSGDIVYVGMDGQVLKATPPPAPVTIYANSGGGGGGRSSSSAPSGGDHSGDSEKDGGGGGD